jgi:hypothetical protein
MSDSIKTEAQTVDPRQMIEQCKSVLKAGGTVYLGENHTEANGRNVCKEVLASRCVQYLCIEFNDSGVERKDRHSLIDYVDFQENQTKVKFPDRTYAVPMKEVVTIAVDDPGCEVVCIDATHFRAPDRYGRPGRFQLKVNTSTNRQENMRVKVKECRSKITMIGRGVLVLVGSDHLVALNDRDVWQALQRIVYDGHSFVYGKYNNCYMVWQLS